ncbi:MAG TPA: DUF1501 domain-containing protein [Candidatus Limnocylindria bacterium]|jgi:hypothetical protein|nr:DUF1501 domain-containing protein [Candidatus Limnocylindria bacterium]
MNLFQELQTNSLQAHTRRHFFGRIASGIGTAALASLANQSLLAGASPLAPHQPHFAPRAKRVLYIHMAGSPSQLDLFDYKPKLRELNGQPCPDSLFKKERFAFIKGVPKMLGTPHDFERHGQCGLELSKLLPHLGSVADEMCVIRSMYTDQFNHAPAQLFLHTGAPRQGRPSMGSWLTYGLGTENQQLPGFVVLVSGGKTPDGGASLWGSSFLPTVYQGVQCRSKGDPVLFVSNPEGMDAGLRRRSMDALKDLNEMELAEMGDPETLTRIQQYELAYKMQTSVPELMEIDQEPQAIRELYGVEPGKVSFANNCILARRLLERGVRFVQLYHWGWDSHGTGDGDDLMTSLPNRCRETDRPCAALIKDLRERGLLDDTLIIWGGEFGRTPMNEERNGSKLLGRDHHPHAFSLWMAGGGIKRGIAYGKTDELGYHVAENPVHVHDLQATILHCLGLDHTRLTYRFQGRDYRLTDVHGNVVQGLLA